MFFDYLTNFILGTIPPLGFAVLFNAPRKELFFCAVTGSMASIAYYITGQFVLSTILPTFIGAVVLSVLARIFSYTRRAPSTLFLIPGIIPLVPGARVYNTMKAVLDGNMYLTYLEGAAALKIAGTIALGIIIVFSLPYKVFEIVKPKDIRKNEKQIRDSNNA